jgi:hypothetical protein
MPLLAACSGGGMTTDLFQGNPTPDGGGKDGGAEDGSSPQVIPPTELLPGSAAIVGVTGDQRVVFRLDEKLQAIQLKTGAKAETILEGSSSLLIRGDAVFTWSEVDWTTSLGELSIWTPAGGSHHVGSSLYAEAMIAATSDGQNVVYVQNVTPTTVDIVIASADFVKPQVLLQAVGRGSETTCGPSFGFSNNRLFLGWCTVGNRAGKIERYEEVNGHWAPITLATGTLPNWSASSSGSRVFYQSSEYQGFYSEQGENHAVDTGIGGGVMLPDGSAVLYTVGDQLRRSSLPDVNPIPIVTKNYAQRVEFTPDFGLVLYSTQVTYDSGTRRDLLLASTEGFDPTPKMIVDEPVASMARSVFTQDGKYLFYFTNVTPTGAKLTVRSIDGDTTHTLPGVVDVVAASGSRIVFSDAPSDPEKWPVVATLKTLDLSSNDEPTVLEQKIVDGKSFQLTSDGTLVVYVRAASGEGSADSLVFQSLN